MKTTQPNLLFFFPDQMRFDWDGARSGIPVRTPNLDALRGRGTTFENALCPSPVCAPSRACLAVGNEYDRCLVPSNRQDLPTDAPNLYQRLQSAGYHVTGCGKFDLNKGSCIGRKGAWGSDGQRHLDAWGFSAGVNNEGKLDGVNNAGGETQGPYLTYLERIGWRDAHVQDIRRRKRFAAFPTPLPEAAYCDNWIAQNGLDLINGAPSGKPWFLQINFTGPHNPWDITEAMAELYKGVRFPDPAVWDGEDAEKHRAVRQNYAAMIENIDRWLGVYTEALRERGELENTLIVFSSDHGEMLGDRGAWGKGKPYQASAGVPLVAAGPGVAPGRWLLSPATTLDLTATFLDYAGADPLDGMDSRSLREVLSGAADGNREVVFSGLADWRLAFSGRFKLVRRKGEPKELYDLQDDPFEETNRIDDDAYAEVKARLMGAFEAEYGRVQA